jgi:hypothetical protein
MSYMETIHAKLQEFSYLNSENQREWNTQQIELFRQWLMKFLRRNSQARNEMINCPRKISNTRQILEHFSKHYVMSVPFKIV